MLATSPCRRKVTDTTATGAKTIASPARSGGNGGVGGEQGGGAAGSGEGEGGEGETATQPLCNWRCVAAGGSGL